MLGFRPVKQRQQPATSRPRTPRASSPSPLPVIYEDHSKDGSKDSDKRNSDSSSSSSSDNSLSEERIIWPPLNSPTWPPRDDEPLIQQWNDYGALNCAEFHRFHSNNASDSDSADDASNNNRCHCPHCNASHHERGLHWMDSDVTEVTSNRVNDLHHNYTGSLSYSNSGSLNFSYPSCMDDRGDYSFLNDGSFHRRQRINPAILRIWHLLSVLVMIVFCSSLFLMPSVLQQSSQGEWGGKEHGRYKHYNGSHANVGGEEYELHQHQQQEEGEHEREWKYPKPWKYLFGIGNDDQDDNSTIASNDLDVSSVDSSADVTSIPVSDDDKMKQDEMEMLATLSNITFASLASIMLPSYLQTTIELCKSTILPHHKSTKLTTSKSKSQKKKDAITNHLDLDAETTSTTPDQVFVLRKQVLKTRDLLDTFSPVYPPHESKYHKGDLNFETRDIHYAKYDFGLELEKDGRFKHGSDVQDVNTVDKREMFGHDHHANKDNSGGKKKHHLTKAKRDKYPVNSDLWKTLRKYLDEGYTIIGSFQDLDHASIQYSEDQLASSQREVWAWYVDFMTWIEREYLVIMRYLSHPCPERKSKSLKSGKKASSDTSCRFDHSHSSHLFWGGTAEQDLPDGKVEMACVALGRLGSAQLQRARGYLDMLWDKQHVIPAVDVDEPIEKVRAAVLGRKRHSDNREDENQHSNYDAPVEEAEDETPVHEIYHNLRKELRSFLDEVDLFGTLLLPGVMGTPEVIALGLASEQTGQNSKGEATLQGDFPPVNVSVNVDEELGPQVSPPINQNPPPPLPPPPQPFMSNQSDDTQRTFEALSSLKQTRKLLGDLNDDYTAYVTYVEWDTNHGEQVRLMSKVETEWNNFRWWAGQIGLGEQIDYLISRMTVQPMAILPKGEVDVQDPGLLQGDNMNDRTQDPSAEDVQSQEQDTSPSGGR